MTIDGVGGSLASTVVHSVQGQSAQPGCGGLNFFEMLAADLAPLLTALSGSPAAIAFNVTPGQLNSPSANASEMAESGSVEKDDTAEDAALPAFPDPQTQLCFLAEPASSALQAEVPARRGTQDGTVPVVNPRPESQPARDILGLRRNSLKPVAFTIEIADNAPAAVLAEPHVLPTTRLPVPAPATIAESQPDAAMPSRNGLPTMPAMTGVADEDIRMGPEEIRPVVKLRGAGRKVDQQPSAPHSPQPAQERLVQLVASPGVRLEPSPVSPQSHEAAERSDVRPVAPPVTLTADVKKSATTREFVLQVPSSGDKTVQVHLTERAGHVRVTVRCSDPQITTAMRNDLGDLVRSLTSKGYQIDAWTPPETHPCAHPSAGVAAAGADAFAGDQPRDAGTPSRGTQWDDQPQQNRPRQRWLDELERRLEEE